MMYYDILACMQTLLPVCNEVCVGEKKQVVNLKKPKANSQGRTPIISCLGPR